MSQQNRVHQWQHPAQGIGKRATQRRGGFLVEWQRRDEASRSPCLLTIRFRTSSAQAANHDHDGGIVADSDPKQKTGEGIRVSYALLP
ncbi:hypothetical protein ACFL5O_01100 [Myxococcota bacterium]